MDERPTIGARPPSSWLGGIAALSMLVACSSPAAQSAGPEDERGSGGSGGRSSGGRGSGGAAPAAGGRGKDAGTGGVAPEPADGATADRTPSGYPVPDARAADGGATDTTRPPEDELG